MKKGFFVITIMTMMSFFCGSILLLSGCSPSDSSMEEIINETENDTESELPEYVREQLPVGVTNIEVIDGRNENEYSYDYWIYFSLDGNKYLFSVHYNNAHRFGTTITRVHPL